MQNALSDGNVRLGTFTSAILDFYARDHPILLQIPTSKLNSFPPLQQYKLLSSTARHPEMNKRTSTPVLALC
jgi:hypothetical protein